MDLVLFSKAEGAGEEAGVIRIGFDVGDASGLVLEAAVDDAGGASLHFRRANERERSHL